MKLKLFPKNEQELSKLFVLIFPLTLLLSFTISFFKNAYFNSVPIEARSLKIGLIFYIL